MNAESKRINELVAISCLLLPLALHWLLPEGPKWEQAFTTIQIGNFRYSWIIIFYLFYYFLCKIYIKNKGLKKIRGLFLCSLFICPFILAINEEGMYTIELFLSAIPFYVAPLVLITKPPQVESFKLFRLPFFFILVVSLYFYSQGVLSIYTSGLGEEERVTTLVGSVNISSYFVVILSCLISEIYIKSDWQKFLLLMIVMGMSLVGACRGAVLFMGLYIIIILIKSYKRTTWYVKLLLIFILSSAIYYAYTSDLFLFLSQRNEELAERGGDFSSGRGELITTVYNNAYKESPIIGVGHGRVFPSSKDLLVQRNERNFHYSKYAGAPHNAYVVVLTEYGIIGAILVIIGVVLLLKSLDYRKNLSYLVVLMLFVLANTEAILLQDDFWPLFWIIVAISLKGEYVKSKKNGNNSILSSTVPSHTT